jgi:DNA-binding NtrC family response regulator
LELQEAGAQERESCHWVPRTADELKEIKKRARERAVLPIEKAFVLDALRRNRWNITRAAEETGMLRPNFQALLKKLDITPRDQNPEKSQ